MSGEIESVDKDGVRLDTFRVGPWTVVAGKSHILHSKCVAPVVCGKLEIGSPQKCLVCRFEHQVELPSFPDMTFAKNVLRVLHENGFGIQFTCIEALKLVKKLPKSSDLQVGIAEAWQESRTDCAASKRVLKPFDWTYANDYQGTFLPEDAPDKQVAVSSTEERIDIEKLKKKDEILYFENIDLFEDELADHGVAQLSAKIRVMKGSFFILLRYFLRIDGIKAQINDTRYFHEFGTNFMIREYTVRESETKALDVPIEILTDPVQLSAHLPLIRSSYDKLTFPS